MKLLAWMLIFAFIATFWYYTGKLVWLLCEWLT